MKYAARRTWPKQSTAWEYQGEASEIGRFAAEFAYRQRLDLETEFVVIEQAGPDSDIQFFKVTGTAPYQVTTSAPRVESASPSAPTTGGGDTRASIGISPFISTAVNMTKVGVTAIALVLGAIYLIRYIKGAG